MLRKLLLLPPLMSLLLLAGCGPTPEELKRQQAVDFTSESLQFLRQQKYREALIAIDKAIALEPTGQRYFMRGEANMEGDRVAALADFEKAVELDPNNQKYVKWKESVERALGKKPAPRKKPTAPTNTQPAPKN